MPPALSLLAQQATASNVCTTPLCHAIGNEFLQYVNLSVDPCSDFFEYSCGAWVTSDEVESEVTDVYEINGRHSLQNIISFLNNTFEELSEIIKTDDTSVHTQDKVETDRKNFQVAKSYYESCLNYEARIASGATPIFPIIAEIENSFFPVDMPVSPQNMANALAASTVYGIQTIFTFSRIYASNDRDYKVANIDVLDYDRATSVNYHSSELYYRASLTDMLSGTLGDSSQNKAYNTLIKQESQINNMTLWSASKIQSAITNIIEFEKKMRESIAKLDEQSESEENTNSESTTKSSTETSTEDIEPNTERSETVSSTNLNRLKNISKTIDWEHFFSLMVSPEYATGNPTVLFTEEYLVGIDELISSTPVQVLQDYWIIQTIVQMHGHINAPDVLKVTPPGNREEEPFFDATYINEPFQETDQTVCGAETSKTFYNIIGRFFALQTLGGSKEKEEADQFVDSIHPSWLADLPNTSWLDDTTKTKVIEKIQALKKKVAYSTTTIDWRDPSTIEAYYTGVSISDVYLDNYYSTVAWKNSKLWKALPNKLNGYEWSDDNYPEQVNAFYNPGTNSLEISIGNFRGPFYSPDYPKYLNYGNLGATVGHELVHALDSTGRFFDAQGFYVDWFSKESSAEYEKKAQCFVDQHSNFTLGGVDGTRYPVNGVDALGENIADVGGMTIAYKAYHRYLKAAGLTEQTLPGFENVTPDQLFFINSVVFTCSTEKKSVAKSRVKIGPHSPGYFRNIGTMQNSVEFAQAFNCPVGSPMNPEAKCAIW